VPRRHERLYVPGLDVAVAWTWLIPGRGLFLDATVTWPGMWLIPERGLCLDVAFAWTWLIPASGQGLLLDVTLSRMPATPGRGTTLDPERSETIRSLTVRKRFRSASYSGETDIRVRVTYRKK